MIELQRRIKFQVQHAPKTLVARDPNPREH